MFAEPLKCPRCHTPFSAVMEEHEVQQCPCCETKFVMLERALTYIDEIPLDEHLGG